MLDCRAQEQEIAGHALFSMGKVRSLLQAIGRRAGAPTSAQELEAQLNTIASACQARPVAEDVPLSGRIGRMSDAAWWRRNLRREITRENEIIEHGAGDIRRKGQVYVSDHACKVKGSRAKANAATLEGLEVVNEDGEAFNLGEVVGKSVSNPKIRRAELMMRCRGFEEAAAFHGHSAQFLTITCPSRFHRFDGAGQPNKKWSGATPKDAQAYLCRVWSKIRAAWKRQGFAPYGFRVAEPHHDGCPHWHILLFMPPEHIAGITATARDYAMADSPSERGADKHRFTAETIDTSKGSATGYIAKYISKNIDGEKENGEAMGLDFASGKSATEASARVRVWASTWGIRQFQQIGGPSVTVWRELRRLGEAEESLDGSQMDLFAGPQNAADRSLWALFWILQGGPDVPRSQLTLKPLYVADSTGRYGDEVERILGVTATSEGKSYAMPTRLHTWIVQRAGLDAVNQQQAEHLDYMDRQANIAAFLREAGVSSLEDFQQQGDGNGDCIGMGDLSTRPAMVGDIGLLAGGGLDGSAGNVGVRGERDLGIQPGIAGPWTGVNNCTGTTKKQTFDFSQFDDETEEMPYTGTDRTAPLALQLEEVDEAWKQYQQINRNYAPPPLRQ